MHEGLYEVRQGCGAILPQTRSLRSGDSGRSRSAEKLLLTQKTELSQPLDGLLQDNPAPLSSLLVKEQLKKNHLPRSGQSIASFLGYPGWEQQSEQHGCCGQRLGVGLMDVDGL